MKQYKKGALELSINTIVIIVIGVTLLSLGLFFIRGLFTQINEIRDDIFDRGRIAIDQIGHAGKFNAVSSVDIEQGDKTTTDIFVAHDGSVGSGDKTFTVKLIPNGNFEHLAKAKIISPSTVTLQEGQEAKFVVQVAVTGNTPLSTDASYQIIVECNGCSAPYATGGFAINILERTGFFG